MDSYLVDYLKSGKAWLLVGSGPSSAMGYPSWARLASEALEVCSLETIGADLRPIEGAFRSQRYEEVFERAAQFVGIGRLLEHLRRGFEPDPRRRSFGAIYDHLARWPISVYLTTNYDHEITRHLAHAGEASYIERSNSEDDLSTLLPDTSGSVVHLHGDLHSEAGLILTSSQYRDILGGLQWQYWRTKMTSIFQMNRVIVIGHSLHDPHISHVLEAAKKGAGVVQPVCWIAPDVPAGTVREYLEKYRIRVVTYDNRDQTHGNLFRMVEALTDFVPPRVSVHVSRAIENVSRSPLGTNAGAPGFFVFTKLSENTDLETKQLDVMLAALRAVLPRLQTSNPFSIQQAFELAGWPASVPVSSALASRVVEKAVADGLLARSGVRFAVTPNAEDIVRTDGASFQHLRARFQQSLENRLARTFPALQSDQVTTIAGDIDAALTGYFREGGLTLASTLSSQTQNTTIPSSILTFVNQAAAKYAQQLMRQAFSTVSLQCFIRSEPAEREYLGRISQGFFAFHLLGVFGNAALERLRHARDTVWLVDSSAQIAATALGSSVNAAFRQAFQRLSQLGIRLFTTERLFDETRQHLWFANHVVTESGATSPNVIAAARGDVPYRKANLFLEGFINWQAAGNPGDWDRYLISISGQASVGDDAVRAALSRVGIETISFADWPGFSEEDHAEVLSLTERIVDAYARGTVGDAEHDELYKKANPEAEALIIVVNERQGTYYVLSDSGQSSPAWFLSQTAILNVMHPGMKITWQPEAFLRFASTLTPASDEESADRAFETLVWSLAQSGVTVLDDRIAATVFGGIIDQAKLSISEQHAAYERALERKYGEPIESVLERVPKLQQPLAALQLANERAETELSLKLAAQAIANEAVRRNAALEKELATVERYRQKVQKKQNQAAQRKRQSRSHRKQKGK